MPVPTLQVSRGMRLSGKRPSQRNAQCVACKRFSGNGPGYVQDRRPEEIKARYFKDWKDGLQVRSLSHSMKAQV